MLDAKVQELVENRIDEQYSDKKARTRNYLRNITQGRMTTVISFILKCIDGTSIEENTPKLFEILQKINRKRNKIVHEGESASRAEAREAVIGVAKIISYLNKKHGGYFEIPQYLLSERDASIWF